MVSLRPLESVGYNQAFFKIPKEENSECLFTYYTFDNISPPALANYWNIIGFRRRLEKTELFDLQWFFVDDDELSMKDLEPVQYASRFMSIRPSDLLALIEFFEKVAGNNVLDEKSPLQYFHLLDVDELAKLHFKDWAIEMYVGNCYCYTLEKEMDDAEHITLVSLPQWVQRQKLTQGTTIEFTTFERQQLTEPEFFPFDVDGLATITFTQQALEEFIILLKHHTYEAALRAFQS